MYVRKEVPMALRTLAISRVDLAQIISAVAEPFYAVFTGYGSYREHCKKSAAWGGSARCALFADWGDDGVVTNIWAEFFDREEKSISEATGMVAAIGRKYPLIYVDWAWDYVCNVTDEPMFSSMLRAKLDRL
jgi:hypothetical protein